MPFHLKERVQAHFGLWQRLAYCYWYLLQNLSVSWHDIGNRTFATWYSKLGHHFAAYEAAFTPVPRLVGLASGTVLELGPASGNQFPHFDRTAITRIYGVEPNEYLFNRLRSETIEQQGLSDIYVPINAALEDAKVLEESWGVGAESIDTIVCMQVLCSVAAPAKAAEEIYRLLKPGGQLLFWEHHASRDPVTRILQGFWNLFWTPVTGNCTLNRDVEQALLNAGDWNISELSHDDEMPWNLMPRVSGRFVKPQA